MNVIIFTTDEENTGSDSDIDLHDDEDIAETNPSRTEHMSTLSQKSEEILCNKSALHESNDNQDPTEERTMFRTSHDMCSVDIDFAKKHMSEIKDGVWPMMLQTQSSSSLGSCHLQTLDFSGSPSQQFLKLGAPLLFHPGQLSVKPDALSPMRMGQLFSFLPGVNNEENGGLSSQSITSPSPLMFQLPHHMLASQVRFSRSAAF